MECDEKYEGDKRRETGQQVPGGRRALWETGPDKLPQQMIFKLRQREYKERNHADFQGKKVPGGGNSSRTGPKAEVLAHQS